MPKKWKAFERKGVPIIVSKRRSVEKDFPVFHTPKTIWEKINKKRWRYKTREKLYQLRDLAWMCLLYLSCSRVSELCRFKKEFKDHVDYASSVTKDQFREEEDFIWLSDVRIVKRRFKKVDKGYVELESVEDYPTRASLSLPTKGELSIFTNPVKELLSNLSKKEELFKFRSSRGYQIVNHCTGGLFPHYLRDMGLKLRLRLYGMNIAILQDFSGHVRIENLTRYLKEKETEEARRRMLSVKLEDFEPQRM